MGKCEFGTEGCEGGDSPCWFGDDNSNDRGRDSVYDVQTVHHREYIDRLLRITELQAQAKLQKARASFAKAATKRAEAEAAQQASEFKIDAMSSILRDLREWLSVLGIGGSGSQPDDSDLTDDEIAAEVERAATQADAEEDFLRAGREGRCIKYTFRHDGTWDINASEGIGTTDTTPRPYVSDTTLYDGSREIALRDIARVELLDDPFETGAILLMFGGPSHRTSVDYGEIIGPWRRAMHTMSMEAMEQAQADYKKRKSECATPESIAEARGHVQHHPDADVTITPHGEVCYLNWRIQPATNILSACPTPSTTGFAGGTTIEFGDPAQVQHTAIPWAKFKPVWDKWMASQQAAQSRIQLLNTTLAANAAHLADVTSQQTDEPDAA